MFAEPRFFWLFLMLPIFVGILILDMIVTKRRVSIIAGKNQDQIIPYYSEVFKWIKVVFYSIGFILCIFALARPKWGSERVTSTVRGRNILITLDISLSMATADFVPSRLDTAKRYINELLAMETGDKIGIQIFSGHSELLIPMTHDYGAISFFLDSIYSGMLGKGGTNISKALIDAIEIHEDDMDNSHKMILLITDGEDLEGQFKKIHKKLINSNIKVFTVGVGTPEGKPIPIKNAKGEVVEYIRDKNKKFVISKLDENILKEIAISTGGSYIRTTGDRGELKKFIKSIDNVEMNQQKELTFTQKKDHYDIFLIPALFLFCIGFILDQGRMVKKSSNSWFRFFNRYFLYFIFLVLLIATFSSCQQEDHFRQRDVKKLKKNIFLFNNGGYWGNKQFKKGKYKKALDSYISATKDQTQKNVNRLYYNIANTFYQLNDYKNANLYFEKAKSMCKDDELLAKIFYNQGIVQFKLKEYHIAQQQFKKTILINQDDEDARYNYFVSTLLAQNMPTESKQGNQVSPNEKPQKNNLNQNLADILSALDQKEKEEIQKLTEEKQNQDASVSGGKYW
ncbi:MAG: VWA domain-containing protein [Spirochaetes bacterium]|nr:VWA domain-containing protein [Spirochaetota bacterium]